MRGKPASMNTGPDGTGARSLVFVSGYSLSPDDATMTHDNIYRFAIEEATQDRVGTQCR
jgi:hypothetical protein